MPIGPEGDEDRFEDFDECVSTLSEDEDMSKEEAKEVCGGWQEEVKQSTDTHTFWGMVLSEGEVSPANKDFNIYYTQEQIQANLDGIPGTDIRLIHTPGEKEVKIGETLDYKTLEDNVFVLCEIQKDLWDNFVQTIESEENVKVGPTYNQLTKEIDAGNLALSAGLRNVVTTTTPTHENTVLQYNWGEISIVPQPASPGAWAWQCDDQCKSIFGLTMSNEGDIEIEANGSGDGEEGEGVEQGDVNTEPQTPETIEMGDEKYALVPQDDVEQSDCSCNTAELKQQLEEVEEERDNYKEMLQQVQQQKREEATSELKELNQQLPEEAAYDEERLEQMCENKDVAVLEDKVDMMQRTLKVAQSQSTSVQQSQEEDLTGAGESTSVSEEEESAVDEISQNLFGMPLEEKLNDLEADHQ